MSVLTVTTHQDPDHPASADIERLQRELAAVRAQLENSHEAHRAEVHRIRNSMSYRLGARIISLRRLAGWRGLPADLRTVARLVLQRRTDRSPTNRANLSARSTITVDSILDEFSQQALEHELTLRPVTRTSRPRRGTTELFIAESAWLGNGGIWRHQFSGFETGNDLDRLIGRYRDRGVPTVFWNKEDPPHFETFLPVAGRFDLVLTTDEACVERYRHHLGHDRVDTLPFAAQPALHNPTGRVVDQRSICFAGAWRGDVHPQRVEQLTTLLDAALTAGELTIFARRPSDGRSDFPDRYRDAIRGEIAYREMVAEYRRHACFLNVNSVTTSPTMLSRRVFEILACRTPVVSAPSPAIERFFGDTVPTPGNVADATALLDELVSDPTRRDRLGQRGYRLVMKSHTYQHRIAALCQQVGVDGFPEPQSPTVDAVVEIGGFVDVDRAMATIEPLRGSLGHVTVVCADRNDGGPAEVEHRRDMTIIRSDRRRPPAEYLHHLPGTGQYVALLDVDARYGDHFIDDTMLATRYVDVDVLGKSSSHTGDGSEVWAIGDGREFHVATHILEGTAIVRRARLEVAGDRPGPRRSLTASVTDRSASIFAVDRFNHVAGRRRADVRSGPVRPISDAMC